MCATRNLALSASRNFLTGFMWIPGHSGIVGNKRTDEWAGTSGGNEYALADIPPYDLFNVIRMEIFKEWTLEWKLDSRAKWYETFVLRPLSRLWFKNINFKQKSDLSQLIRIRTNHCCSPMHLNRIGVKDDPLCLCGLPDLNHIFLHVPFSNHIPTNLFFC